MVDLEGFGLFRDIQAICSCLSSLLMLMQIFTLLFAVMGGNNLASGGNAVADDIKIRPWWTCCKQTRSEKCNLLFIYFSHHWILPRSQLMSRDFFFFCDGGVGGTCWKFGFRLCWRAYLVIWNISQATIHIQTWRRMSFSWVLCWQTTSKVRNKARVMILGLLYWCFQHALYV